MPSPDAVERIILFCDKICRYIHEKGVLGILQDGHTFQLLMPDGSLHKPRFIFDQLLAPLKKERSDIEQRMRVVGFLPKKRNPEFSLDPFDSAPIRIVRPEECDKQYGFATEDDEKRFEELGNEIDEIWEKSTDLTKCLNYVKGGLYKIPPYLSGQSEKKTQAMKYTRKQVWDFLRNNGVQKVVKANEWFEFYVGNNKLVDVDEFFDKLIGKIDADRPQPIEQPEVFHRRSRRPDMMRD